MSGTRKSARGACAVSPLVLVLAWLTLAATPRAEAASVTYTSSAAFEAAIAGEPTFVENYSGFTAGQLVPNGTTLDGLTYTYPLPTPTLQGGIITTQFNSFSGKSLGGNQSDGLQFFFDGDEVTVTFAKPVTAFGLFFNVNPNSGTYGFNTSVGSATTGSASYDTSTFVFAGLVSTTAFSSATIFSTSGGAGTASYNIPEILTATIPEPSAFALLASGLGLGFLAFRGRAARRSG